MQILKTNLLEKTTKRIKWETHLQQVMFRRFLWDCLKSPHLERDLEAACLYSTTLPPKISSDDPIFTKPGIRFTQWSERPVSVYHWKKPVLIEPEFGYAIGSPFSIIDASLPECELARSRHTASSFSGVPSLRKAIASRTIAKRAVRNEACVITLRHPFDYNYFHFFYDMMSRLQVLSVQGIDENIPIVVSQKVAQTKVFQSVIQCNSLAKRNWICQDNFYIHAEEVIFSRARSGSREQIDFFLDAIEIPESDRSTQRRIFLMRSLKDGRALNNIHALMPILERFELEIVDSGQMTFEAQRELFGQAGLVVGIHGAGLTNIIFRRNADLTLLEIFPPTETDLCYYAVAKMYGFNYDYLIGEQPENKRRYSNFALNPTLLQAKLEQILGRHL